MKDQGMGNLNIYTFISILAVPPASLGAARPGVYGGRAPPALEIDGGYDRAFKLPFVMALKLLTHLSAPVLSYYISEKLDVLNSAS
ncbi:hypothetical protein EVAR_52430_1 [Eumeta japonica]|uniref:Uncharacterized protein n=1 Tax=Eumeta variegata TaxID=151549 RepID=A0A4C1YGW0_EUMVA|nr:hypothetical protein EVAR_52430_1 [Eumeta japonica]